MERVQKILSHAGLFSRRQVEELIKEKRITINDKIAIMGAKATGTDIIKIDNKPISLSTSFVYYKCNKPKGFVCTCSIYDKRSVCSLMPKGYKLHLIGRLDKDSTGLIIFTNDGELTNVLTHPKFGNKKKYIVTTKEPLTRGQIEKLTNGVVLDNKKTNKITIKTIGDKQYQFTLTEGRFQHIRRAATKVGNSVTELQRTQIASCHIGNIKEGETIPLTTEEITILKKAI